MPTANQSNTTIISKQSSFQIGLQGNSQPYCSFNLSGNYTQTDYADAPQLEENTWTHIICRYDGAVLGLYINSVRRDSTLTNGTILSSPAPIILGSKSNSQFFQGGLDELRIYNFAITTEQISQRHDDTKNGESKTSTIASWQTQIGENWTCQITPTDGEDEGDTLSSNTLQILRPDLPTIIPIGENQTASFYYPFYYPVLNASDFLNRLSVREYLLRITNRFGQFFIPQINFTNLPENAIIPGELYWVTVSESTVLNLEDVLGNDNQTPQVALTYPQNNATLRSEEHTSELQSH